MIHQGPLSQERLAAGQVLGQNVVRVARRGIRMLDPAAKAVVLQALADLDDVLKGVLVRAQHRPILADALDGALHIKHSTVRGQVANRLHGRNRPIMMAGTRAAHGRVERLPANVQETKLVKRRERLAAVDLRYQILDFTIYRRYVRRSDGAVRLSYDQLIDALQHAVDLTQRALWTC